MLIVGERINASRKPIAAAIESRAIKVIQDEAKAQDEAGADYIDVNAGLFGDKEAEYLQWMVQGIQVVTDKPLCIDSADPEAIELVMPLLAKPPMINSIIIERSRLERVLPLVKKSRAKVIGLCQSEALIARSFKEKMELAGKLVEKVIETGIPLGDLYIDPLTFPLATDTTLAVATLDAIEGIMREYPGVHTICGLTNVSHGLPLRSLVNRTFLVAAMSRGLDAVIMDPTDKAVYSAFKASMMLLGKDEFCLGYIQAFREGRLA